MPVLYRTTQPNLMMDVNAGLSQPSEGVQSHAFNAQMAVFQGISDTFIRQLNDLMQDETHPNAEHARRLLLHLENFNMIVQDPNLVELLTLSDLDQAEFQQNIGDCFPGLSEEKAKKKFEKVFGTDMTQNFVLKTFKVDCEKCMLRDSFLWGRW